MAVKMKQISVSYQFEIILFLFPTVIQWRIYQMKEKLEIVESILSIIVSLIAIYGTIISVYSGFWKNIHNWFLNNL